MVGIVLEAVEVVLGVEDYLFSGLRQVAYRVPDRGQVLLRRRAQDLLDVHLPALGDDAGDGRGDVGEERNRRVVFGPSARTPGAGKGHELRILQLRGVEGLEELRVFGVGGREARFDVVEP